MESTITEHIHNGIDSKKINIKDLDLSKGVLTAKNITGLTSGGAYSLTTQDSIIIDNMRTRINELETILKGLGLLE